MAGKATAVRSRYSIGGLKMSIESRSLGADYGEKSVNNDHTAGGISPSSKSRSKRTPGVRAYHRRNRGNDGVARNPQWKRPNAQKHGAFSVCPTIPGEDPREFQELHSALIDEWQPSGPSEEDAVFSLADLMWSKLRAQRFPQPNRRQTLSILVIWPLSPALSRRADAQPEKTHPIA